jgi:hypothetical protein
VKSNTRIAFNAWAWLAPERPQRKGGAVAAFEYGARLAFRGDAFLSVYSRGDCTKAERDGFEAAGSTIAGGEVIVTCDDCRQPYPVFRRRRGAGR